MSYNNFIQKINTPDFVIFFYYMRNILQNYHVCIEYMYWSTIVYGLMTKSSFRVVWHDCSTILLRNDRLFSEIKERDSPRHSYLNRLHFSLPWSSVSLTVGETQPIFITWQLSGVKVSLGLPLSLAALISYQINISTILHRYWSISILEICLIELIFTKYNFKLFAQCWQYLEWNIIVREMFELK